MTNLTNPIHVRKEVAKVINTSEGTLHKAQTIAREKPELLKQIDAGKESVYSAYKKVVKEKKEGERKKAKAIPIIDATHH